MKKLFFAISIVLLGSALLFQGCGSKGPPRPPKASGGLSQPVVTALMNLLR